MNVQHNGLNFFVTFIVTWAILNDRIYFSIFGHIFW
jgi:hypothetical protein